MAACPGAEFKQLTRVRRHRTQCPGHIISLRLIVLVAVKEIVIFAVTLEYLFVHDGSCSKGVSDLPRMLRALRSAKSCSHWRTLSYLSTRSAFSGSSDCLYPRPLDQLRCSPKLSCAGSLAQKRVLSRSPVYGPCFTSTISISSNTSKPCPPEARRITSPASKIRLSKYL